MKGNQQRDQERSIRDKHSTAEIKAGDDFSEQKQTLEFSEKEVTDSL